jgi:hypothetical protein
MTFHMRKDGAAKKLVVEYQPGKCLHLYHYQIHPVFGFMHARLQTWFPFHAYVCINGREWLARQLDRVGLGYQRRDNCFTALEDVAQAQALLNDQLQAHWPDLLQSLAASLNPLHQSVFARFPTQYYWSVAQSEWASDVLFRTRADLEAIYPRLLRHAITTYGAADVLRFLGRKIPSAGGVPAAFAGQVETDIKVREEGVRIKHWLNHNSLKLYDKGSALRSEVTLNDPTDFRVFRASERDPDGPKGWRSLRYGIADLHRRAEVCQAANERYLEALAAVADTTPLRRWVEPLCQPVTEPRKASRPLAAVPAAETAADSTTPPPAVLAAETATQSTTPAPVSAAAVPVAQDPPASTPPAPKPARPRRVRALNPLAAADATLLEAASRHEFLINGLRNRDLRRLLYATAAADQAAERRRSAAISRKLRLLRAHGLIHKVPKTHRYLVSPQGRNIITALLAARDANADLLTTHAA